MSGAPTPIPVSTLERFSWAMYDFANSGYTTIVLTTVFNAYFVATVAAGAGYSSGTGTFLWTSSIAVANTIVLLSAPVVGAVADYRAWKKRFLLITTVACVAATASLGFVSTGDVITGVLLVVVSAVMFASGQNLIAAFLPEISSEEHMGRLSGYGWGLGYFGGLLTLALCLAYVTWAEDLGHGPTEYVPVTLWITAGIFAFAALPTFLWLRERASPRPLPAGTSYISASVNQIRGTLNEARQFKDLFYFLGTLVVFQAGVSTVVVVAAIYVQQVFGFTSNELIILVMVVNVSAAVGAPAIGHIQDRFGSVRALALALTIWIVAIVMVMVVESRASVWLAGNLIGLAMGSCQAAGRALVGHFTPVTRTGEFFGLWGLATNLAAIIGPASYGLISYLSDGNQRAAVGSTLAFFVLGLALLTIINEDRGKQAAADYIQRDH